LEPLLEAEPPRIFPTWCSGCWKGWFLTFGAGISMSTFVGEPGFRGRAPSAMYGGTRGWVCFVSPSCWAWTSRHWCVQLGTGRLEGMIAPETHVVLVRAINDDYSLLLFWVWAFPAHEFFLDECLD
jgi:hypothetical protein